MADLSEPVPLNNYNGVANDDDDDEDHPLGAAARSVPVGGKWSRKIKQILPSDDIRVAKEMSAKMASSGKSCYFV